MIGCVCDDERVAALTRFYSRGRAYGIEMRSECNDRLDWFEERDPALRWIR